MSMSSADIATGNPTRLITRLCKHWGHNFPVRYDDSQGEIELSIGNCFLAAIDGGLRVRLEASDEAQLNHLQTVVAAHLDRMARDETLTYDWQLA